MGARRVGAGRSGARLRLGIAALALALGCAVARPASAQVERVAAGTAGLVYGAATGVYTTTAIYVTKARFGRYIYSLTDVLRLRWETLPILAGPITGAVLGSTSPGRLGRSALWGGIGFVGGAGLGYLAGHLIAGSDEARWAGGIIGSATGLVAGAILGALDGGGTEGVAAPATFEWSVPVGLGGGGGP